VVFSQVKEHDIPVVSVAVELFHYQCSVGDPGDLRDDEIFLYVAILPIKM
jgi:hypothetical protein